MPSTGSGQRGDASDQRDGKTDSPQPDVHCIDAVQILAKDVPLGYRVLLSREPPRAPFVEQCAHEGAKGPSKTNDSNKKAGAKRSRGASVMTKGSTVEEIDALVRQAIVALCRERSEQDEKGPVQRAYVVRVGQNAQMHQPNWPALLEKEISRRGALQSMRKAWNRRIGATTMEEHDDTESSILIDSSPLTFAPLDLCCRLVLNPERDARWLKVEDTDAKKAGKALDTRIHLPPRSAFLVTNLLPKPAPGEAHGLPLGWSSILAHAKKYPPSIILLDPPYPNYSAKRLKRARETYSSLGDLYDLWRLVEPVKTLLAVLPAMDAPLVACCVTNDPKAQRFVLTKLFPAWQLEHVGQLVWLKTTADHRTPVLPLDNKQGRKPYEILLLGRPLRQSKDAESAAKAIAKPTHVFACAPFGHSRKPPVLDLLKSWLPSTTEPLHVYELFARSVSPGFGSDGHYVSIGNEPCFYNQVGVGLLEEQDESRKGQ